MPPKTRPLPAIAETSTPPPPRGRATGEFTDRLLDIKEVSAKLKISRSKIYAMMGEGQFPQSIHIAPQMTRWRESTLDEWLDGLEAGAASTRH